MLNLQRHIDTSNDPQIIIIDTIELIVSFMYF